MIYTRMGREVEIIDGNLEYMRCRVRPVDYGDDKRERRFAVADLCADGGINEIVSAIKKASYCDACGQPKSICIDHECLDEKHLPSHLRP